MLKGLFTRYTLCGHGERESSATSCAGERERKEGPGSEAQREGERGGAKGVGRLAGLELLGRR
ncbi:hypothetical protein HMPREF2943_11720 [Corynebacterium sp. HMSC072D12]|nr:hypothetical protein HMPREF2943_11720 [Corynebacterium sp. HMSC072D12]